MFFGLVPEMSPIVLVVLVVVLILHSEDDVVQFEVSISHLASHRQQQIVAGVRSFVWFHEMAEKEADIKRFWFCCHSGVDIIPLAAADVVTRVRANSSRVPASGPPSPVPLGWGSWTTCPSTLPSHRRGSDTRRTPMVVEQHRRRFSYR